MGKEVGKEKTNATMLSLSSRTSHEGHDASCCPRYVTIWISVCRRDGNLALVAPTRTVREVFKITSLDKIFVIYDSEMEALKHFSA